MKLKFNALMAAAAMLFAGAANATITGTSGSAIPGTPANAGNSEVLFVALGTDSTGAGISLTVDLGVSMSDFLSASTTPNVTATSGQLSGQGATASWNFSNNTTTLNGTSSTDGNSWTSAFSSFAAATSGNYTWAVLAADSVTGNTLSATNTIAARNLLITGTPTTEDFANVTSGTITTNGSANLNTFIIANNALTGHSGATNGAATATVGDAYLDKTVHGNFNTVPWSGLTAIGSVTNLFLISASTGIPVYQLGTEGYQADTLLDAADAATFTFDGTTLSYQVAAVPEASTYAMLLAGLGAVGFIARRRKAA